MNFVTTNKIPISKISEKEIIQNSFHKKFSDFSAKLATNLFSVAKLNDKPDYIEIIIKLIKKLKELKSIYSEINKIYSDKNLLQLKKHSISNFLYNFLYKILINDLKDLTFRFIKKKIISFEEK